MSAPIPDTPDAAANENAEEVLVIEDNLLEQARLQAMLNKFGYRVHCVASAEAAVEHLHKQPLQLILTDWRMPGMSGIELCRVLRSTPEFGQPYVILVTGMNSKNDLVAGMDAGADDFISKPFNGEELRVRVQAGARIVRLRGELDKRHQELHQTMERETEINAQIRRDLDAAARMQRELLPGQNSPFPDLQIGTLFMPAIEVAGDTFNFCRLDERHLAFYHIDVAGHGLASAMLSFTLNRILSPEMQAIRLLREAGEGNAANGLAPHITAPSDVVAALNRRFLERSDESHYFTMVYGVLNVNSGHCVLCQAGHPPPLLCSPDDQIQTLGEGGFPVGLLQQADYMDLSFQLEPGDTLFLYSDGITDLRNEQQQNFGSSRLERVLPALAGGGATTATAMLGSLLERWKGDQPLFDDCSMLSIGYR